MKKDKIPFISELMDSCRLLPAPIGFLFFWIVLGPIGLVYPVFAVPFYFALIVLLVVIILLVHKYFVFLWISRIENAIAKRIIWIHTKNDRQELNLKKMFTMISVIILTCMCFLWFDGKVLVFFGLLCLVFSLKVFFYVPVVELAIIENGLEFLQLKNGKDFETTELEVSEISSIAVQDMKLHVTYRADVVDLDIAFVSESEKERVFTFLQGLKLFKVVQL